MINSGIITNDRIITLENQDLITYLYKLLDISPENKQAYEIYQQQQLLFIDTNIIDYFVQVLGYIIIYNKTVYFPIGMQTNIIDKVAYVMAGYKLQMLSRVTYECNKFIRKFDPIQQEIDRVGFEHANSHENNLSFWYPKTANLGFKTPKSIIMPFTKEEISLIKNGLWDDLNEQSILTRIKALANNNQSINLNDKLFVRLGISSNKFNFKSCWINDLTELYSKLMTIFDDLCFKLEWSQTIELVLREYITPSYQRPKIYNGMPLNTEFRVFYDFDQQRLLGIVNYWEKDTMLNNLHDDQDLVIFAKTTNEIEQDFIKLSPILQTEVENKLPNALLTGKWSIDFLFDGQNFVLIDMAHAECSYYYDQVLAKQRKLIPHKNNI